jgi:hypothetical protein
MNVLSKVKRGYHKANNGLPSEEGCEIVASWSNFPRTTVLHTLNPLNSI